MILTKITSVLLLQHDGLDLSVYICVFPDYMSYSISLIKNYVKKGAVQ